MTAADLPRIPLAVLPTPLEEAPRLSRYLGGPSILVKRDDLTGLALGGNKTRKLEYLLADAVARRADTVVTLGAAQSNHARQTAAACNRLGLRCVLVLRGAETAPGQGNLLLDHVLGAEVRLVDALDDYELAGVAEDVARELRDGGARPYLIPYGGSSAIGAAAYVAAFEELQRQLGGAPIAAIVHATTSGGTQAGLLVGALRSSSRVQEIGISAGPSGEAAARTVTSVMRDLVARLEIPLAPHPDDVIVYDEWVGPGYALPSDEAGEAIRIAARTEGLILDPAYTGKAMAGLIGLVRRGAFSRGDVVVFWHTGGTPALFAMTEGLVERG